MKKRILTLVITMIMVSATILPMAVSAAVPWFHLESLKFEQYYTDAVIISMDVRKTEEMCYMFTLSSPKNADDPYSTVTWSNLISFTMTTDGDFRASVDGAWFNEESNGISVGKLPADGRWHNIRLKVMLAERAIEMYLDDKLVHNFDIATRIPVTTEVSPCNMITVSGDSTYKATKGYEAKISSVIGVNDGELGVAVTEHNAEDKTVTVAYTDRLSENITGAVLKKTDILAGENEIPLSVKSRTNFKTVFGYSEKLEDAKEYAVILPEDIEGVNGEKPESAYLYFVTSGTSSMINVKNSDYTTYDTNTDIKLLTGASYRNRSLYKDSYPGTFEIFAWQGDYAGGAQTYYSVNNWAETDKPEIPTGKGISEISYDITPKKANMSFSISLTHSGRNNNVRNNGVEIAFDEAGNIICSCGVATYGWSTLYDETWAGSVIGKYEADKTFNIKYVIDKPNKKVYVYLNDELKKTVDETSSGASQLYSAETSNITFYEMFGHEGKNIYEDRETLFLLDNVKLDVMKEVSSQPSVRFSEIGGREKGAYDKISRKIDSVSVGFTKDVNEDTLNSSTVKLSYNGIPVEYSVEDTVYNSKSYTYTIYPRSIPESGDKIEVEVSGVKDTTNNIVESFKVYATADERTGIYADKLGVSFASGESAENLGGELYVNAVITNADSINRNILVSFAGYTGNVMKKLGCSIIAIPSGTKCFVNGEENPLSIDTTGIERVEISVQDAETGSMICDSFVSAEGNSEGSMIYSGVGATPDSVILVDVYTPEKGIKDLENTENALDVVVYKTQVRADENGNYNVAFDIDREDTVSGMYSVYAYGNNYSETGKILYVNPNNAKIVLNEQLIPALSEKDENKVAKILIDSRYDLYIDDKYIDEEIAEKAAKLAIEYHKAEGINISNAEIILNKAVAIGAFEAGRIDDILEESKIFDLDNSEIAEFYGKSYVAEKTRADVTDRLNDKKFDSIEDFDSELNDAFVLAVVANPVEPKSAMNVMKGLGLTGYTTAQYNYVSGNDYDSISELKKALDSYKTNSGSSGGGSGSSSGGRSQSIEISAPVQPETEQKQEEQKLFNDLADVLWAEEAILKLAEMGVVNGKSSGVFAPHDNVTREEFTKMIVSALDIKGGEEECGFVDVRYGEWYEKYINIAYGAGIIKGYSDEIFGLGENITREDMAVMICRGAEKAGINLYSDGIEKDFADDSSISDYASDSVYVLKSAGIISGKDNNMFEPKAYATRAEAAKMIYGLIAN